MRKMSGEFQAGIFGGEISVSFRTAAGILTVDSLQVWKIQRSAFRRSDKAIPIPRKIGL